MSSAITQGEDLPADDGQTSSKRNRRIISKRRHLPLVAMIYDLRYNHESNCVTNDRRRADEEPPTENIHNNTGRRGFPRIRKEKDTA
eukprot:scaffold59875_cov31-Cyclotella_meneghiniana.AAC.1